MKQTLTHFLRVHWPQPPCPLFPGIPVAPFRCLFSAWSELCWPKRSRAELEIGLGLTRQWLGSKWRPAQRMSCLCLCPDRLKKSPEMSLGYSLCWSW